MQPRVRSVWAPLFALVLLSGGLPLSPDAAAAPCPPAAYVIQGGATEPFCEVRDAVAAAPPGATVAVVPRLAPYREAVAIHVDGITLCAASGDGAGCSDAPLTRPIMDATGFDAPALTVAADDVTVRGLGFQGSSPVVRTSDRARLLIDDVVVTAQISTTRATDGIRLVGTVDATVRDSELRGNLYAGSAAIHLTGSSGARIEANTITQSGTAIDVVGGTAWVGRNAITVSGVRPDPETSVGIRFVGGSGHRTDGNTIDGVGTGVVDAGSVGLRLEGDVVRSVPVGIRIATDGLIQPGEAVFRDLSLSGADTPLRIAPDVEGLHLDARCNDWGAYTTKAIAGTRIRDEGRDNAVRFTPYKAYTSQGLACLTAPTAAFAHSPIVADRLTDVRFTSAAMAGTYPIMAHDWDLGDGMRTTERDPTHRFASVGTYPVRLMVTDTDGMQDMVVRSLVVRDLAPVVAAIADQSVMEGQTVTVPLRADDPEGDPLEWSVSPLVGDARVEDGDDGPVFTWTPDHYQAGRRIFALAAHDGFETTTRPLNVTVADVDGPPVITPVPRIEGREGSPVTVRVEAADPDGSIPALALFVLPVGATFTDHHDGTGTFAWAPTYFQDGTYLLTLQASDGWRVAQATVRIDVLDTNRAPTLQPIPDRTSAVGDTVAFVVSASDPDGDPLSISVVPVPRGGAWDPATRRLTWTPSAAQAGEGWSVTATADDGKGGLATRTFWLRVSGDVRYGVRVTAPMAVVKDGVPGNAIPFTFTVQNLGTTARTFALALDGVPLGWDVTLPAPTLTLQPGESRPLSVNVVPDGRHLLGRVVLRVDDGLVQDTLTLYTLVPVQITVQVDKTIPVEGKVFIRYLDGRPVAGLPFELRESTRSSPSRILRGTTGDDGSYAFAYDISPLGSNMPGRHEIHVMAQRVGGASWGHGEYWV